MFWLILAVACFFCGRYWDEVTESLSNRGSGSGPFIKLQAGRSRIITAKSPVPRLMVNNPAVAGVTPLTPTQLQVTGISAGTTTVTVWDVNGKLTTYDVSVVR